MTLDDQAELLRNARRFVFAVKSAHAKGWSLNDPVSAFVSMAHQDAFPARIEQLVPVIGSMPLDWREYCAAAAAAVFLGAERRKRFGIYLTPPMLVSHILARLVEFGYDPASHRIMDPAAGGAAFLGPVFGAVLAALGNGALQEATALVKGMEVEPRLAAITESILSLRLAATHGCSRPSKQDRILARSLVIVADTLGAADDAVWDVIIGNPPYVRIGASDYPRFLKDWPDAGGEGGYINLAMVFVLKSLRLLREGGLLAFILPAGFIGGPSFSAFRRTIAPMVLAVDRIEPRERVFADAIQDCVVLILRKGGRKDIRPHSVSIDIDRPARDLGVPAIPVDGSPWTMPTPTAVVQGADTLRSLGWQGKVGPVVAYRWKDKLFRSEDAPERVPGSAAMIWAAAIGQDGSFEPSRTYGPGKVDRVAVDLDVANVIQEPCVLVQRTSSSNQKRRICAAAVDTSAIRRHAPLIADNHVIVLYPPAAERDPDNAIHRMAARLNSEAMSEVYARSSGTVSVSIRQLMDTPLPHSRVRRDTREWSQGQREGDAAVIQLARERRAILLPRDQDIGKEQGAPLEPNPGLLQVRHPNE